jgi:hypothetical protein
MVVFRSSGMVVSSLLLIPRVDLLDIFSVVLTFARFVYESNLSYCVL